MPWWLVFSDDSGNPCLRGPYYSHMRAIEKRDRLDREGSLYQLSTSSKDEATRQLKEMRIDEFGVEAGTRNFRHKNLGEYEVL